jgi:hypothetical protein
MLVVKSVLLATLTLGVISVEGLLQLGLGGATLLILYMLLKPLINSLVESQKAFVANQERFALALKEIVLTVSELRKELIAHFEADKRNDEAIMRAQQANRCHFREKRE